jgi:hypothetical protein
MKQFRLLGMITLLSILFLGCSVSRGTINSYIEPTYNSGAIKSIAMFPIRNARFAPSEARQINKVLIQAMNKKNPKVNIVAPSKALRMINESGLASEWANFVEDYYTSGIADKKVLSKFAKALKVDAIFQGSMFNIVQADASDFVSSTTRVSVSFSVVETKTAKVIWESTSDGIRKEDKTMFGGGEAVPIKEALDLAIAKIKDNMPLL